MSAGSFITAAGSVGQAPLCGLGHRVGVVAVEAHPGQMRQHVENGAAAVGAEHRRGRADHVEGAEEMRQGDRLVTLAERHQVGGLGLACRSAEFDVGRGARPPLSAMPENRRPRDVVRLRLFPCRVAERGIAVRGPTALDRWNTCPRDETPRALRPENRKARSGYVRPLLAGSTAPVEVWGIGSRCHRDGAVQVAPRRGVPAAGQSAGVSATSALPERDGRPSGGVSV